MRYTWGTHINVANNAGNAYIAKDPRQPKPISSASGTLIPAATVAPKTITLEYRLVMNPDFFEKFLLVRLGSRTLPKAMATPRDTVPMYRAGSQSSICNAIPAVSNTMAPNRVPPIPKRLVNIEINAIMIPKMIKGSVVKRPKSEFDSRNRSEYHLSMAPHWLRQAVD